MFRRALWAQACGSYRRPLLPSQPSRWASSGQGEAETDLEQDYAAGRQWKSTFNKERTVEILSKLATLNFVRASGPGGQKVNNTASKVIATWPLESLRAVVPRIVHQELNSSKYYARNSNSLIIQSKERRNQHENRRDCYEKLSEHLLEICKEVVPGETSPAQKSKVQRLTKFCPIPMDPTDRSLIAGKRLETTIDFARSHITALRNKPDLEDLTGANTR